MIARRLSMTNWIFALSVVAIAATATFLSLGTQTSVHAQGYQGPVAQVADLVGEWNAKAQGCGFENVLDPASPPRCDDHGPGILIFDIKVWNGRAFAGTFLCSPGPCGDHLTGAVGEDGSVMMQTYRDNNRNVFVAKLSVGPRNTLEMKGFVHSFEDLGLASLPGMSTTYFTATKTR